MKISMLISQLEGALKEHGDLAVSVDEGLVKGLRITPTGDGPLDPEVRDALVNACFGDPEGVAALGLYHTIAAGL